MGLPTATPVATPVTNTTPLPDNTKAGPALTNSDDDPRKKKRKRQLQIDFLGFGVALTNPLDLLVSPAMGQWWAERQQAMAPARKWLVGLVDHRVDRLP